MVSTRSMLRTSGYGTRAQSLELGQGGGVDAPQVHGGLGGVFDEGCISFLFCSILLSFYRKIYKYLLP